MISFQIEPWATFISESEELINLHKNEIGDKNLVLNYDYKHFATLELYGQLQVVTCRKDGKIIGYVVMMIKKHPHYDLLCGFEDAYYLHPEERKGRVGIKLLRAAIELAKDRGVKRVFFHSKVKKDLKKLFSYLNFTHLDELWSKDL